MQQLPAQTQKFVDDFKKSLEGLSPEERVTTIKQMTETINSMNQDMNGMIGILQAAKDKRETEELKSKMHLG